MGTYARLQENVTEWASGYREWTRTAIRECGHHTMYRNSANECVICPQETARGYVSLAEALELAYRASDDDSLLAPVYTPSGSLLYFGFNGGGPATDRQKHAIRVVLSKHAGNPTVEAVRRYLNRIARDPEAHVTVSDVSPVLSWARTL